MKKYSLLLILTMLCLSVQAQKSKDKCSEEEFRAKKQAYLTEQAGLTKEEAAKFFPIYYELQALKKDINKHTVSKKLVEIIVPQKLNGGSFTNLQTVLLQEEKLKRKLLKLQKSNQVSSAKRSFCVWQSSWVGLVLTTFMQKTRERAGFQLFHLFHGLESFGLQEVQNSLHQLSFQLQDLQALCV